MAKIYVVLMQDGTVKVGRAANTQKRFLAYKDKVATLESDHLQFVYGCERLLIHFCRLFGEVIKGNEYFRIDIQHAVKAMNCINKHANINTGKKTWIDIQNAVFKELYNFEVMCEKAF